MFDVLKPDNLVLQPVFNNPLEYLICDGNPNYWMILNLEFVSRKMVQLLCVELLLQV